MRLSGKRFFQLCWLSALAALTACTTHSLQELRKTAPVGSAFQKELARHYLEFSESEARQYDWYSSKYFADKGLMAAYGKDVPPEMLENWRLSAASRQELFEAREALKVALTEENKSAKPEAAAEALFHFDCWVEQQEEAWQSKDIASCKEHFHDAMEELQEPEMLEPVENITEVQPVENIAGVETAPASNTSYLILYNWNEWALSADATATLDQAAAEWSDSAPATYVLNGHTDSSGTEQYNMELSLKRAAQAKTYLVKKGVPAAAIQIFGFGESDPKVKTADGVREAANRRVEIFLSSE